MIYRPTGGTMFIAPESAHELELVGVAAGVAANATPWFLSKRAAALRALQNKAYVEALMFDQEPSFAGFNHDESRLAVSSMKWVVMHDQLLPPSATEEMSQIVEFVLENA